MVKKLKYYKKLKLLGIFRYLIKNIFISNKKYQNYISFFTDYYLSIIFFKFVFCFNKLINLVFYSNFYLFKFFYLFIDLKLTNLFCQSSVYSLLKTSKFYCIYDWTYGVLSNFFGIHLSEYLYQCQQMPVLIFLLELFDQYNIIINELKKRSLLSIGLVSYKSNSYIDYPVFLSSDFSESSFVFFKFILYSLKNYLVKC